MPNRMIRSDLLDSDRYWECTIEARELFIHMMLLADDCGCLSLAPAFLGRRAFLDRPTNEKLAKLLGELVDQDLIRVYNQSYALIPRFGQRLQITKLKHPLPPPEVYSDDQHATEQFNKIINKAKKPTVAHGESPPEVEVEVEKKLKPKTPMSVSQAKHDGPDLFNEQAKKQIKSKAKALEQQAKEILEFLNQRRISVVGSQVRGFKPVRVNLQDILARLREGYEPADCRKVIANRCMAWQEKPEMHQYLTPQTLFRPKNFAKYVANLGMPVTAGEKR